MIKTMLLTGAIALGALSLAAPAQAAPFCTNSPGGFGVGVEFGVGTGFRDRSAERYNDRLEQYKRELQRRGVNATSVEIWNGCLQAFVRNPDGTNGMEFYDPSTYRRVF
ncbi:hypothetical protein EMQ25_10280 [Arsenicitalea aurantiaca]|uniref:Uncharacterized protein n=1 Tax=Arsenicitalea aurantiaca TaxID=1783274 RepID=A0A433XAY2_9HYPH|nr:hypothetical protein [Arsenicitalea aurantiaca]RUT31239.1 hypothetical protein EMQ25_10280 [Arsenicitalea aurantiaca]